MEIVERRIRMEQDSAKNVGKLCRHRRRLSFRHRHLEKELPWQRKSLIGENGYWQQQVCLF